MCNGTQVGLVGSCYGRIRYLHIQICYSHVLNVLSYLCVPRSLRKMHTTVFTMVTCENNFFDFLNVSIS